MEKGPYKLLWAGIWPVLSRPISSLVVSLVVPERTNSRNLHGRLQEKKLSNSIPSSHSHSTQAPQPRSRQRPGRTNSRLKKREEAANRRRFARRNPHHPIHRRRGALTLGEGVGSAAGGRNPILSDRRGRDHLLFLPPRARGGGRLVLRGGCRWARAPTGLAGIGGASLRVPSRSRRRRRPFSYLCSRLLLGRFRRSRRRALALVVWFWMGQMVSSAEWVSWDHIVCAVLYWWVWALFWFPWNDKRCRFRMKILKSRPLVMVNTQGSHLYLPILSCLVPRFYLQSYKVAPYYFSRLSEYLIEMWFSNVAFPRQVELSSTEGKSCSRWKSV